MSFALKHEQLTALSIDVPQHARAPRDEKKKRDHVRNGENRCAEWSAEYQSLFTLEPESRENERNEHCSGKQPPRNEARRPIIHDECRYAAPELREQQPETEERERDCRGQRHS